MATAWTYSDWITYDIVTDGTTRLTRLRLHIQEVTDKVEKERTAGGRTASSHALQRTLEVLMKKETDLVRTLGVDETAAVQAGRLVHGALRNRVRSTES